MSSEKRETGAPALKPVNGAEKVSLPPPASTPKKGPGRRIGLLLLLVAVLGGIGFGVKEVVFYRHHAETDDAQIEGHIDPVLPKVSGYVMEVLVIDNQKVAQGQLLVKIDGRDLKAKVDTARAALENSRAKVAVAKAQVTSAQSQNVKAARDLTRYAQLRQKEEVSQQQYDAAQASADLGEATVLAAERSVAAAQADVAQKKADLDFAALQLSYVEVPAPVSGVVSKKNVEVGQFVQAGQPLLAIVEDNEIWVVANFKETQLTKMRVGQKVEVKVDAYPKQIFHGKVESIAAATGAKFALLPPDNATGNFTKVVQRVPVKIVFTDPPDSTRPLRAGMSVTAIVNLG